MTAFPPAKHDALGLDGLLGPEERAVRDRVRQFAVRGGGEGGLGGWLAGGLAGVCGCGASAMV